MTFEEYVIWYGEPPSQAAVDNLIYRVQTLEMVVEELQAQLATLMSNKEQGT